MVARPVHPVRDRDVSQDKVKPASRELLRVVFFFNVTELSKINSRHKSQHEYFECDSPPSNNIAELRGFSEERPPTDRQS